VVWLYGRSKPLSCRRRQSYGTLPACRLMHLDKTSAVTDPGYGVMTTGTIYWHWRHEWNVPPPCHRGLLTTLSRTTGPST